jgi:hypothetical protein
VNDQFALLATTDWEDWSTLGDMSTASFRSHSRISGNPVRFLCQGQYIVKTEIGSFGQYPKNGEHVVRAEKEGHSVFPCNLKSLFIVNHNIFHREFIAVITDVLFLESVCALSLRRWIPADYLRG